MSTAKFDTLSTLDGSQSVPVNTVAQGSAKAWVNFNGTGTVAIRASFNVTSITDLAVGRYEMNFSTAMSDANYSAVGAGAAFSPTNDTASGGNYQGPAVYDFTASSVKIHTGTNTSPPGDWEIVCIAIFR